MVYDLFVSRILHMSPYMEKYNNHGTNLHHSQQQFITERQKKNVGVPKILNR